MQQFSASDQRIEGWGGNTLFIRLDVEARDRNAEGGKEGGDLIEVGEHFDGGSIHRLGTDKKAKNMKRNNQTPWRAGEST